MTSLCCTKCKKVISKENEFGIYVDGSHRHVFIYESVITKTVKKVDLVEPDKKKKFSLLCMNCNSRVGSEFDPNIIQTSSPSHLFVDGELTSVKLKNKIITTRLFKKSKNSLVFIKKIDNPKFCFRDPNCVRDNCWFLHYCDLPADLKKLYPKKAKKSFKMKKKRPEPKLDENFFKKKSEIVKKTTYFFPNRYFRREKYFSDDIKDIKNNRKDIVDILGHTEFFERVLQKNKFLPIFVEELIIVFCDVIKRDINGVKVIDLLENFLRSNFLLKLSRYIRKDVVVDDQFEPLVYLFEKCLKKCPYNESIKEFLTL